MRSNFTCTSKPLIKILIHSLFHHRVGIPENRAPTKPHRWTRSLWFSFLPLSLRSACGPKNVVRIIIQTITPSIEDGMNGTILDIETLGSSSSLKQQQWMFAGYTREQIKLLESVVVVAVVVKSKHLERRWWGVKSKDLLYRSTLVQRAETPFNQPSTKPRGGATSAVGWLINRCQFSFDRSYDIRPPASVNIATTTRNVLFWDCFLFAARE